MLTQTFPSPCRYPTWSTNSANLRWHTGPTRFSIARERGAVDAPVKGYDVGRIFLRAAGLRDYEWYVCPALRARRLVLCLSAGPGRRSATRWYVKKYGHLSILNEIVAVRFEWDEKKKAVNLAKHGVDFTEAKSAFPDLHRLVFEDRAHSRKEPRLLCLGRTPRGILSVRYTRRRDSIRIIGAGYWRKIRRMYEKENG
jgi:uncharacterized protein